MSLVLPTLDREQAPWSVPKGTDFSLLATWRFGQHILKAALALGCLQMYV